MQLRTARAGTARLSRIHDHSEDRVHILYGAVREPPEIRALLERPPRDASLRSRF